MLFNRCEEYPYVFRCRIMQPLLLMTDIERYNKLKLQGDSLFRETSNLIFQLNLRKANVHKFETICWELWGSGFNSIEYPEFDMSVVEEQIKLVELFITSSLYWN